MGIPISRRSSINQGEPEKQPEISFTYRCQEQAGEITYYMDDIEVFKAIFFSENMINLFFEKLKPHGSFFAPLSGEQKQSIYTAAREIIAAEKMVVSDEQLNEYEAAALQALSLKLLKESLEKSAKRTVEHLPHVVAAIWEKVVQSMGFAGANSLRDRLHLPDQKYSAKEMKAAFFQTDWELIKLLSGVTQGGARPRKSKSPWDAKKSIQFYQTVESLPRISKKPMWEYAQEQLRDNDYTEDTIQWLGQNPAFANAPADLLNDAASIWRSYDEDWVSLPPESKPQAFSFRHACHKLGINAPSYNTLRKRYYEGKKASEEKA